MTEEEPHWRILKSSSVSREEETGASRPALGLDLPPGEEGDLEIERGRVFHRPDHPNRVLGEDFLEGDEGLDPALLDIPHAADVVDESLVVRAVVEGVEGEVPAQHVLLDGAELVVRLRVEGPEGGNLDDLFPEVDVDEPEAFADDPRVPEEALELPRVGVGDDVEVFRLFPDEEIPDRAADDVDAVARGLEPHGDPDRVGIDIRAFDVMFLGGVDLRSFQR